MKKDDFLEDEEYSPLMISGNDVTTLDLLVTFGRLTARIYLLMIMV